MDQRDKPSRHARTLRRRRAVKISHPVDCGAGRATRRSDEEVSNDDTCPLCRELITSLSGANKAESIEIQFAVPAMPEAPVDVRCDVRNVRSPAAMSLQRSLVLSRPPPVAVCPIMSISAVHRSVHVIDRHLSSPVVAAVISPSEVVERRILNATTSSCSNCMVAAVAVEASRRRSQNRVFF